MTALGQAGFGTGRGLGGIYGLGMAHGGDLLRFCFTAGTGALLYAALGAGRIGYN